MPCAKLIFILLNAALFTEALVYGLIAPLVPYYAGQMNATSSQLGMIFAVYSLALLLSSFPAGIAVDRFGYRPVLQTGLFVLIAATLFFARAESMWLLALSRILQGAAGAFIWTAALAAATVLFPRTERGGRLGLMMGVTGLGTISGPIVSGIVSNYWGYQAPFIGTALVILPVAVGFIWLPLPARDQEPGKTHSGLSAFLKATGDANVALVLLLIASASFGLGTLELLMPLHLSREFNLGSLEIGIFFSVLSLAYSIIQPLWGYLADRAGYWRIILSGLAGTALITPALSLATKIPVLYVFVCLFSFASAAVLAPCLPLLAGYSDEKEEESYGKNIGLANAAYSLGLLLGPTAGGVTAKHFSFTGATLLYSALLIILGAGILNTRRKTVLR